MNTRFKNLQPPRENMFKKKSNVLNTESKINSRWRNLNLEDNSKTDNFKPNSFRNKSELKTNSRWNNLDTSETPKYNSFKHNNNSRRGGRGGRRDEEHTDDKYIYRRGA